MSSAIKLQGEFRFDVFDANHNLLRSRGYVKNFITNSGVKYPYFYAFADCFRYLSLGSGTAENSIEVGTETTGLDVPVPDFAYIGRENFVTGGMLGGGCGNRGSYTSNTVSLFRQWALPDVTGGVFDGSYNFTEFMVSPGRPPITGWTREYGYDGPPDWNYRYIYTEYTGSLCSFDDVELYAYSGWNPATQWDSERIYAPDSSQTARYYGNLPELQEVTTEYPAVTFRTRPNMCESHCAFARVVTGIDVAVGEILTVTYRLNLSFDTGLSVKTGDNTNVEGNWSKVGVIGGITNPGIKLINDGTLSTMTSFGSKVRLQHSDYKHNNDYLYSFANNYGESFIPTLGMPLEPSAIYGEKGNFIAYFTDDNTQFFVNPIGGAVNTGLYQPWNAGGSLLPQNSGIIPFRNSVSGSLVVSDYSNFADFWTINTVNPRLSDENSPTNHAYPDTGDVTTTMEKSPSYYYAKFTNPRFSHNARTGEISTTYEFPGYATNNYPNTLYVKSFDVAYRDAQILIDVFPNYIYQIATDTSNKMVFFDSLMSGVSGSSIFLPTFDTGGQGGSPPSRILNADSIDYNTLESTENALYPQFTNKLTWIAECPNGVLGC